MLCSVYVSIPKCENNSRCTVTYSDTGRLASEVTTVRARQASRVSLPKLSTARFALLVSILDSDWWKSKRNEQ